jgi:hypothetical protein
MESASSFADSVPDHHSEVYSPDDLASLEDMVGDDFSLSEEEKAQLEAHKEYVREQLKACFGNDDLSEQFMERAEAILNEQLDKRTKGLLEVIEHLEAALEAQGHAVEHLELALELQRQAFVKEEVFASATEGLTLTQKEKLRLLTADYQDVDRFAEKLNVLIEQVFPRRPIKSPYDDGIFAEADSYRVTDSTMAIYTNTLNHLYGNK